MLYETIAVSLFTHLIYRLIHLQLRALHIKLVHSQPLTCSAFFFGFFLRDFQAKERLLTVYKHMTVSGYPYVLVNKGTSWMSNFHPWKEVACLHVCMQAREYSIANIAHFVVNMITKVLHNLWLTAESREFMSLIFNLQCSPNLDGFTLPCYLKFSFSLHLSKCWCNFQIISNITSSLNPS